MTKYLFLAIFFLSAIVYRPWLLIYKTLSSGDWPYLFSENIKEFSVLQSPFLWLDPYYRFTAKLGVEYLSLPWEIVEKIFWFYPFIIICTISSWVFISFCLKSFFKIDRWLLPTFIGSLIYTTNTYILMIVGGGQMGVAMAYAIAPVALLKFIKLVTSVEQPNRNIKYQISNIKYLIGTGLILAIQLMFDPRVFIITLFACLLFIFFQSLLSRRLSVRIFIQCILLAGIAITLNLFWLVPNFGFYQTHYNDAANQVELDFLSFAHFSNAISLLHPNWPENLFGKTYFLKPEFLLLPILTYSSLLFINIGKKQMRTQRQISYSSSEARRSREVLRLAQDDNSSRQARTIIFFCLLGLLGSFLAKGVNPPFGDINRFLYEVVPGMSIFRDPTKFYLMIVLSYSILIPFSLHAIYQYLISNFKFQISNTQLKFKIYYVYLLFTIYYLLFVIRPALFGQLGGTFKPMAVPEEYIVLKEFLNKDTSYSPVLWIPFRQRFGFYSTTHRAIDSQDVLGKIDSKEFNEALRKESTRRFFNEERIKYIILPYDSSTEIFLHDYKYSSVVRSKIEKVLDNISWLNKQEGFGNINVYRVKDQ